MSKGDSDKKLMVNMYDIKDDKDTNLLPGNIRKNTKILGVTGTLDPQADESDATATSSDIALNKSAYVNNEKIYGSVVTTDDGLDTLQTTITDPNITYSQGKINIESPVTTNQNMLLRQNSQIYVEGSINQNIIANKVNLTADKIKVGTNILGVTGNYTSDANATSIDIIGSNKTAYVNGQKIIGTHYFIIDGSMFMLSSIENVANLGSNIEITTNNLSGQYVLRNNAKIIMDVPQTDIANVVNLTSDKIKFGENILGIEGNVIAANLTNLDVTPSINTQSISPNSPYNGFNVVNIAAVTSDIDPNITSNNIRSGVTILGVTGDTNVVNTYVEKGTYMPVNANDIPDYRVAYVNGERIVGTVSDARGISDGEQIYDISETTMQGQHFIEVPRHIYSPVIMDETCSITDVVAESDIANVINLTPDKVRAGTNVLDITGTFTSDANATAINIKNGVTAYVNGQLIVGNLPSLSYSKNPNNPADYNYEFAQGTKAYTYKRGSTNYLVGTNQIAAEEMPDSWMFEGNRKMKLGIPFGAAAKAVGLTSNLLIAGANILGIKGNVIAANLTNLDVIPSINTQSITPNSPYNGFNVVNITAVNANIDPNIISNNIRSGVNILGVTGNVKEGVPVYESEEDLQEVVGSDGDLALVMKNETVKFADFPTSISVGTAQNKTQDRTEYTLTGGREGESGTIIVTSNYSSTIRRYYHFWNIKFTNYLGDVYNIAYSGNKYDTQTVNFPIYITKNGTSFTPSETVSIPTELPIIETLQQATAKPPTTICQYSQKEELKVSGLFRYETNKWNLYFFNVTDATADITDVAYGKVFYKGIDRYVGTLIDVSSSTSSTTGDITLAGSKLYLKRTNDFILRSNSLGIATTYEDLAQAIGLTADKIKKGETILGITGIYEGEI